MGPVEFIKRVAKSVLCGKSKKGLKWSKAEGELRDMSSKGKQRKKECHKVETIKSENREKEVMEDKGGFCGLL